jgi:16S rRNA (cytosine1402-N4)-methyltransferase
MHVPVLLQETIEYLAPKKGEIVIDATVGDGGHSYALCEQIGSSGVLLGIDSDADALLVAKDNLKNFSTKIFLREGNFSDMREIFKSLSLTRADIILFDLGLRSYQLENSGRGFSFQKDEPLVMTFSKNPDPRSLSAEQIVNTYNEKRLFEIIRDYGEERFAKRIAKNIVEARKEKNITRTTQLLEIIMKSVPLRFHKSRLHPATKTFQALRIAVNDELSAIEAGLRESKKLINSGGRIAFITFHSLEDRIVKHTFREWENEGEFKRLTKKPVIPNDKEREVNTKSRSAKLRVIKHN